MVKSTLQLYKLNGHVKIYKNFRRTDPDRIHFLRNKVIKISFQNFRKNQDQWRQITIILDLLTEERNTGINFINKSI